MFIENLKTALNSMKDEDFKLFKVIAYDYHINHLTNTKLRKADFEIQLTNFINGKTKSLSHSNFNSYLYALDQLTEKGISTDLLQSEIDIDLNPLQAAILKYVDDEPIGEEIDLSHLDEKNMNVLKNIMQNILTCSVGSDSGETQKNLKTIDDFLSLINRK
ncbi:hypothetical protein MZM54_03665 [[Brevibacterium] frigoritolerans]|nr:hypothetical protein [Peribacillus frigoritolerans]